MLPAVFTRLIGRHGSGHESYFSDQLKDKYENLSAYFNLCALSSSRRSLQSTRPILCCDALPFGCSAGEFVKHLGKPQHQIKCPNDVTDLLFVYRQQWSSFKVKSEFHFARHGLFYFNRTFPHLSPGQKQELLRVIDEKYYGGKPVIFAEDKIVDMAGNEILVSQNLVLSIDYLGTKDPACTRILETMSLSRRIKQEQADRRLAHLYQHL